MNWNVPAGTVAVATAALATLAACGGTPSAGRSPSAADSASGRSDLAFAQCMRSHGIPNFPDPQSDGHFDKRQLRRLGISSARMRAATTACQNLLPAGPPPLTAQQRQIYVRVADCMRAHGFSDFPDPTFDEASVKFPIPSAINTATPQFVQAVHACQRLIPAGLPYSGSDH